MSFVNVSKEAFVAKMTEAGFTQQPAARSELVFTRRNNNEDLVVKIYSSIPAHAEEARADGEGVLVRAHETYAKCDEAAKIVGHKISVRA